MTSPQLLAIIKLRMADNLVDPQSAVNAALGGTVNPEPTPPTPTPPPPPIPATDPVTPPAPPTPPPTPPTPPEPVAVPVPPSAPEAPIEPAPAMSPDLPLAFAKPASDQKTEATTVPPAPTLPVEAPKKKGKLGVILAGILGLFIVLGGSVFGYLYYTENLPPSKSTVANIQTQYPTKESCVGVCDNNRLLRWDAKNGRCEDSGKACDATTSTDATGITKDKCVGGNLAWCEGCGGYCMRFAAGSVGCQRMSALKCGEGIVTGASCSTTKNSQFFKPCNCENGTFYFDSDGICNSKDAVGAVNPAYYDTYGLCATEAAKAGCGGGGTGGGGTGTISCNYVCNNSGCTCNSGQCQVYHWKCDRISNLSGGCQDGTPKIGQSASFSASCGAEQIDVVCNGASIDFRSKVNSVACTNPSRPPTVITSPSPSPSPSPSTTTAMSCTGISKNVATPEIGDKVTFTCAGSTTPASLGISLAYNFRYNINSGNWQTLANKTSTTAELSVDACGTYAVQCRACLTTAGTTTCDPVWQGATQ